MNILVTGSNGQLGMSLRSIAGNFPDNFIFTDLTEPDGVPTERLDITDSLAVEKMIKERDVNLIINCAAYTDVDRAEDNPAAADLLNRAAPGFLGRAAKQYGASMIHISTDYVFGGDSRIPLKPDDIPSPVSVYGMTKLGGEQEIRESGCKYTIIRTAWLYSEYGKNFVKTMLRLFSERDSVNVVCDQVGTPTYASDLARAILTLAHCPGSENRVLHYSDAGEISWYDFAAEIARLAGYGPSKVRPCTSAEFPSKVKRPHYSVLDKGEIISLGVDVPEWKASLEICYRNLKND